MNVNDDIRQFKYCPRWKRGETITVDAQSSWDCAKYATLKFNQGVLEM